MSIWGPDVASYQGVGDWARVRAQGASFAFVKATQGTAYVNPSFAANWHGIKAAGLVRGAYHFASLGDPLAEANHFCDVVATAGGWELGDGMVLDLETGSGDLSKWASLFLGQVHVRTGLPRALYSGAYFYTAHNLTGINAFRWVAAYGSTPQIKFDMWQWTDKAPVAGLGTAVVDRSSYAGTAEQLRQAFGAPLPAPPPPPPPPTEDDTMRSMQTFHPGLAGRVDWVYITENNSLQHGWVTGPTPPSHQPMAQGQAKAIHALGWVSDTELLCVVEGTNGAEWTERLNIATGDEGWVSF